MGFRKETRIAILNLQKKIDRLETVLESMETKPTAKKEEDDKMTFLKDPVWNEYLTGEVAEDAEK